MSEMDEPEESAADPTPEELAGSGASRPGQETKQGQDESMKQNSPDPRESSGQEVDASDDELVEENTGIVGEHCPVDEAEAEDDDYEDDSEDDEEDDDQEDDDEEEDDEEEDDEEEDDQEEDDQKDDDEEEDDQEEDDQEEDDEEDDDEEDDDEEDEDEEDAAAEAEDDGYEDDSEEDEEGEEDAAAEAEDDDYEDDSEDGEEAEDDDYDDDYEDESVTEPSSGTQRSVEDLDGEIRNVVSGDVLESESARSRTQETGFNASRGDSAGEGQSIPAAQEGGESCSQAVDLSTHSGLCFQSVDLPTMQGEPFGMRRADGNGLELLDAMAGRNSVFGYGCTPIRESLVSALSDHLGEGSRFADVADSGESLLSRKLEQVFAGSSSVFAESMAVLPSPDLAVEYAIQITRRFRSDRSFRTIALLGSDHGRTGMCRTASGQPYLHEGLGPMMAGFSHLPMGDLEALRAAIDEQTAGVLLSPIDLVNGAVACSADYIAGVRAVCNERGVLLIIDETQLVFGSTGNHFAFAALADIHADIVVASAGLFAGLPGGLVLASQHATAGIVRDLEKYPLLSAALMSTLDEMDTHGLPATVHDSAREFAVLIAEQLSGFEFVRDMRVTGMTIGIECDVNAVDVVAAAAANGLRVESAGDTAIRIQPPLLMSQEDRELLLKRLMDTMKAIERETAELTL